MFERQVFTQDRRETIVSVLDMFLYYFVNWSPKKGTKANSEDPDEMQQNVAFHQGLHSLLI